MHPLAHETWFTEQRPDYSLEFVTELGTIAVVLGAISVALGWRRARRFFPRPELPFLGFLSVLTPWIPRLLGIHAGVSLLAQAARGSYLAPPLELPDGIVGISLAILEGVLGVWLIAGYRIRPAALVLVISGPLGMIGYGVIPILERVDLLGIALFLTFFAPDDGRPGGQREPDEQALARALLSLRVLVGGALVVLAFTEKLARPGLALAFLDRFPAFNILQTVGLEVSDLAFVRIAGGVELLFGLLIISGALPQVAVIVAGIPFNATLFFLGSSELIGHLPVYGAMLALLVYGSDPRTCDLVHGFSRHASKTWTPYPSSSAGGERRSTRDPATPSSNARPGP